MRKIALVISLLITVSVIFTACSGNSQNTDGIPEGMKLFSGENVDYTAYVPETWVVDMSTGTLGAYVSSVDNSNISIAGYVLDEAATTLDQYWKNYEEDYKKTFSDMEYTEDTKDITVDSLPAKQYTYTATVTGIQYKFRQVVCINSGKVYILTYTSTPDLFDSHTDDINDIISTFKFN